MKYREPRLDAASVTGFMVHINACISIATWNILSPTPTLTISTTYSTSVKCTISTGMSICNTAAFLMDCPHEYKSNLCMTLCYAFYQYFSLFNGLTHRLSRRVRFICLPTKLGHSRSRPTPSTRQHMSSNCMTAAQCDDYYCKKPRPLRIVGELIGHIARRQGKDRRLVADGRNEMLRWP